jgi:hypothetical protein
MVPNRFTRKVTVLLVPGMAVAEGEREVARGESNRQSIWGKTEKASASLFLENLVHVEARAGNQVTFLWLGLTRTVHLRDENVNRERFGY